MKKCRGFVHRKSFDQLGFCLSTAISPDLNVDDTPKRAKGVLITFEPRLPQDFRQILIVLPTNPPRVQSGSKPYRN